MCCRPHLSRQKHLGSEEGQGQMADMKAASTQQLSTTWACLSSARQTSAQAALGPSFRLGERKRAATEASNFNDLPQIAHQSQPKKEAGGESGGVFFWHKLGPAIPAIDLNS